MSYGYKAANKLISHECWNGVAQLRQAGLAEFCCFELQLDDAATLFSCCSHLTQTEGPFTTLIAFFFCFDSLICRPALKET